MSGGCTSFSQQEWVLCHAKTTHLSIHTLPTDGAVQTSEARCDTCILVKTNSLSFAAAVHFKDKDTCI